MEYTFEELCEERSVKLLMGNVLYEQSHDLKHIICNYNKLKFLTHTSQPGDCRNSFVYKNLHSKFLKTSEDLIPCIRKQRALIRGYMYIDVADKLYNILYDHEFLFMKTSNNNRSYNPIISDVCEFGSMSFIDDKPIYSKDSEADDAYIENNLENYPDAGESFRLGRKLCKPFHIIYPYCTGSLQPVVEVEIFDVRWNKNELWNIVLDLLKSV